MSSILQQQCEALAGARYPLHMPGHKRPVPPAPGLGCYAFDLTEIEGADDLHDASGILADAMARTAALYGSARCWYLVGGSTVGLLAGIRATAPFGTVAQWWADTVDALRDGEDVPPMPEKLLLAYR